MSGGRLGGCGEGKVTREVRPGAIQLRGMLQGQSLPTVKSAACSGPDAGDAGVYYDLCDPNCQWYSETSDAGVPQVGVVPSDAGALHDGGGSDGSVDGGTNALPPIDGAFCRYALYTPGPLTVGTGTINGNIASVGTLTVSNSPTINGNVATCGNLIFGSPTINGMTEVQGSFSPANGYTLASDGGTVLWVAGYTNMSDGGCPSGPPTTETDVFNQYNNAGPSAGGGSTYVTYGNIESPVVPQSDQGGNWTSWATWGSNTYKWIDASAGQIVNTFKNTLQEPLFLDCAATCGDGGLAPVSIPTQSDHGMCDAGHNSAEWADGGGDAGPVGSNTINRTSRRT